MHHEPATTNTLRVLDMVAARKLWHQRTCAGYRLVAQPSTSILTVVLDDAQQTILRNEMTLLLTLSEGEPATLTLHIRSPQVVVQGTIAHERWPHAILMHLDALGVVPHQLLPIVSTSTKQQHRRVYDDAGTHCATVTLEHGILDAAHTSSEVSLIHLHATPNAHTTIIDDLTTVIHQSVACIPATDSVTSVRAAASAVREHVRPRIEQLTTHVMHYAASGRDADEALLIPMAAGDIPADRRLVAAAVVQLNGHPADADPFWLTFDEEQRALVRTLIQSATAPTISLPLQRIDTRSWSFADVLRTKLRGQYRRVLLREHAVAKGYHAEDIHRIRVSLRKLNSLLECGLSVYESEEIAQYRRGFRRMARFLGDVRDADAFAEHVKRILGTSTVPHEIRTALQRLRHKALRELEALIVADKHQQFLVDFAQFVCTAPPEGTIEPTVTHYLSTRVTQMIAALVAPMVTPANKLDTETLHDVRIQAKKLRYTIEAFPEVLLPAAQPLVTILEKLQLRLGIIQDAATAHQILIDTHLTSHTQAKTVLTTLRAEANYQRTQLGALWNACLAIDTTAIVRDLVEPDHTEGTSL
ncbi:MAG: CHAD domain-containing protein [Roseiflexaceae bacterium]